ncbi:hypothetical protein IIE_04997 [Bacillus cereus VD045]|nr:hypothetical protein IIE_04997 [Bacillus cereus VD045]
MCLLFYTKINKRSHIMGAFLLSRNQWYFIEGSNFYDTFLK